VRRAAVGFAPAGRETGTTGGFLGAPLAGVFATTLPFEDEEGLEAGLEPDFLKGDLSGMVYHLKTRTHFHYSIARAGKKYAGFSLTAPDKRFSVGQVRFLG
jgi:hypothetical protein